MSERSGRSFNFPVLAGGIALMLAGYGLYRFFSPSPHAYAEIFIAMPVFLAGVALSGIALLTTSARKFRLLRLCVGWALIVGAALPFFYLGWMFIV